jgi:hypothetical protein
MRSVGFCGINYSSMVQQTRTVPLRARKDNLDLFQIANGGLAQRSISCKLPLLRLDSFSSRYELRYDSD